MNRSVRSAAAAIVAVFATLAQANLVVAQQYAKLSHFTEVKCDVNRVEVTFEGNAYELLSINGLVGTMTVTMNVSDFGLRGVGLLSEGQRTATH